MLIDVVILTYRIYGSINSNFSDHYSKMTRIDRLSSLVSQFEIKTRPATDSTEANLCIDGEAENPKGLWLAFSGTANSSFGRGSLAMAKIDYGGNSNPILMALPVEMTIDLTTSDELRALAQLIASEINTPRCGGQIAIDRLCEFLLVSVLRKQIETREYETGLLAGLADPNLSPVLVAIHDEPGRLWKLDDLVSLSAQSRSQFMETFQSTLGVSPISYLRQWRMTLARNALMSGARVKETARKFGYGSGDAFTRAFTQTYGVAPTKLSAQTLSG
ncbi:MAG: AraC family transcriptional regulator [Rhizobiaceae bacterium]|nr:AraC family transcriptional regulator [Rhizobiaceae bacterium]